MRMIVVVIGWILAFSSRFGTLRMYFATAWPLPLAPVACVNSEVDIVKMRLLAAPCQNPDTNPFSSDSGCVQGIQHHYSNQHPSEGCFQHLLAFLLEREIHRPVRPPDDLNGSLPVSLELNKCCCHCCNLVAMLLEGTVGEHQSKRSMTHHGQIPSFTKHDAIRALTT